VWRPGSEGCGGWPATGEACGRMMGAGSGGSARAAGMKEQGAATSLRRIGRRLMGAAQRPSLLEGYGGFAHIETEDFFRKIWSTILHPAIHMKSNGYTKKVM
jgi:hypothetical protein